MKKARCSIDIQTVVVELLDADDPVSESMVGMIILLQDELDNRSKRDNTSATNDLLDPEQPSEDAGMWRRPRFNLVRRVRAWGNWWLHDRRRLLR